MTRRRCLKYSLDKSPAGIGIVDRCGRLPPRKSNQSSIVVVSRTYQRGRIQTLSECHRAPSEVVRALSWASPLEAPSWLRNLSWVSSLEPFPGRPRRTRPDPQRPAPRGPAGRCAAGRSQAGRAVRNRSHRGPGQALRGRPRLRAGRVPNVAPLGSVGGPGPRDGERAPRKGGARRRRPWSLGEGGPRGAPTASTRWRPPVARAGGGGPRAPPRPSPNGGHVTT